jgi:hypothetical protein
LKWQNYKNKAKIHRGHSTTLGVYVPTKGREDLSEEFYDTTEENG